VGGRDLESDGGHWSCRYSPQAVGADSLLICLSCPAKNHLYI